LPYARRPRAKPRLCREAGVRLRGGEVVAASAARRASYEWEYSTDGGKTWIAAPATLQAKTKISGLAQGATLLVLFALVKLIV
jgi:hypothetical protein